jgi:predicted small secreted protein
MKSMSVVLLVLFAWALSGCNTMEGFGKDIQKAGEAIERNAR